MRGGHTALFRNSYEAGRRGEAGGGAEARGGVSGLRVTWSESRSRYGIDHETSLVQRRSRKRVWEAPGQRVLVDHLRSGGGDM